MSNNLESSGKGTTSPPRTDVWLPAAAELAEYPPAFAESIIRLVQEQQKHRHELEQKYADADIEARKMELGLEKRGQVFGFCIGVIALLVGLLLGWHGSPISAAVIGGGGVAGLVTAFLRTSTTHRRAVEPPVDLNKELARRA